MGEISSSLSVGTVDPLLPSHPPCAHRCQPPTDKPWVKQDPLLPRYGGRLMGGHGAKLTNRHHQAGDKQEKKIYLHLPSGSTAREIPREETPGAKLSVTYWDVGTRSPLVPTVQLRLREARDSQHRGRGERGGGERGLHCPVGHSGFGLPKCTVQLL